VLGVPPVRTAADAVRASIIAGGAWLAPKETIILALAAWSRPPMPHRRIETPEGPIPVTYESAPGGQWIATAETNGRRLDAAGATIQEAHEALTKRIREDAQGTM
jgi:hypothetical protein